MAMDFPSTVCFPRRRMQLPPPTTTTTASRAKPVCLQPHQDAGGLASLQPQEPATQLGKTRTWEQVLRLALVSQLPQEALPRTQTGTDHHSIHTPVHVRLPTHIHTRLCCCAKVTSTMCPQSTDPRPRKTVRWLVASLGNRWSPASASQAQARYKGGKRRKTSVTCLPASS
jgi:hypothetical protein